MKRVVPHWTRTARVIVETPKDQYGDYVAILAGDDGKYAIAVRKVVSDGELQLACVDVTQETLRDIKDALNYE